MTAALLSDEKRDALQELVNIGMGAAGAALAKALGTFVELAVPAVDFTSRGRVAALLDAGTWANEDLESTRPPRPSWPTCSGTGRSRAAPSTTRRCWTWPTWSSARA